MIKNNYIDLHAHSTASDGDLSPSELVRLALQKGLVALALTDHDTAEGNNEAILEAERLGLNFVPGVEISVDRPPNSLHILGYWIDPENPVLKSTLETVRGFRDKRNPMIIEKLQGLGIDIDYVEVCGAAGGDVVGRPHFAKVLVEKGVVKSSAEAFQKYLGKGGLAYVDKKRMTPFEGIRLIHQAGGMPALAHPNQYDFDEPSGLEEMVAELKSYGLAGIEAYYSTHSEQQTAQYKHLAEKYDLAITGGSDFHGAAKPMIELGSGIGGNLKIPRSLLDNLRARLYHTVHNQ